MRRSLVSTGRNFGNVVRGEVPQDVRQLQPIAEPDADGRHSLHIPRSQGRAMGAHQPGPELADAAGRIVGILVEIGERGKGDEPPGGCGRGVCGALSRLNGMARKAGQVLLHSVSQGPHNLTDQRLVGRREAT